VIDFIGIRKFGIGFGGIVLEQLFQAGEAIDVSAALQDPQAVSMR
jgi:hypothetical protein